MPDRLVGRLRWLWGGAAVLIATGGALVLSLALDVAPSATGASETSHAVSLASLALVAAGVTTCVALAALIALAPRRHAHLMVACGLAAGVAALVLLAAHAGAGAPSHAALLASGAALALSAACCASWLALWLSRRPSHATAARDERLLALVVDTVLPAPSDAAGCGDDEARRAALVQTFHAAHRRGGTVLRLVLRVLDAASVVVHRRRFASLDATARERFVADLARSRFATLRGIGATLERDVLARHYADPRVQQAIGYGGAWLRERIAAGPNRDAHREREEAELRACAAALAGDTLAVGEDASGDVVPGSAAASPARVTPGPAPERAAERDSATGPREPVDDVPFDRAWTLGVVGPEAPGRALHVGPEAPGRALHVGPEAPGRALGSAREPARPLAPLLRAAVRTAGPTRP